MAARRLVQRMKYSLMVVIVFLVSHQGVAYIEPGSWVIEEMARRIVLQNMPEHSWNGMILTNDKKEAMFATLCLAADGMKQKLEKKSQFERLNLYFLSSYWACRLESAQTCTQNLLNYLKNAGIDINKIGLGFIENEPVYIIGASAADPASPQLWVIKNNFYPVKEKKPGNEFTWSKWTSLLNENFVYPRLLSFKIGNKSSTISME